MTDRHRHARGQASSEALRRETLEQLVARFSASRSHTKVSGVVTEVHPCFLRTAGLSEHVKLGDCVRIETDDGDAPAQVVRIDKQGAIVKSFDNMLSAGLGARVIRKGPIAIAPHESWRGRVLDAFAYPIDDRGPLLHGPQSYHVDAPPPKAMHRARVSEPRRTGVRVVDAFTPLCDGQRVGIFAGSGVGKSTLLSMLARAEGFSVAIICLVGERGREVRDFIETMTADNAAKAITVVATGDESPMMRRLAPLTAMAIAEAFRDRGESVMLIVDSVTRYAHASREVALAAGEPPVANGYTPSVFADLPRLLERAGPGKDRRGAITGIFSVLVDGDNHNEPIADCIRGTLDGHLVLDREAAEQGRYPAVNVLKSISRLADRVWSREERQFAMRLRSMLSRYEETRDFRLLGGYVPGSDLSLDRAVHAAPIVYDALRQSPDTPPSVNALEEIACALNGAPID